MIPFAILVHKYAISLAQGGIFLSLIVFVQAESSFELPLWQNHVAIAIER